MHINKPRPVKTHYRILPKYCHKFINNIFQSWQTALKFGLESNNCRYGFRIFKQQLFDWYGPDNIELFKVGRIENL